MKYICWALGVTVAIWNQERLWKSYVWKWFRIFEPTLTSCVQILAIRADYSINVKGKLNNWLVNYFKSNIPWISVSQLTPSYPGKQKHVPNIQYPLSLHSIGPPQVGSMQEISRTKDGLGFHFW